MIFIVVKFTVKPEESYRWLDTVAPFTQATRQEPGNKWFEWYHSVDEPNVFVLVEAFQDGAAGAHVGSEHFAQGLAAMRPLLVHTPQILSQTIEADDWYEMGELRIDD
jgi:quinol monooxygenase YgiN